MDLGLDSLMAVELRNNLAQSLQLTEILPATLMFDYPSIADIAAFLLEQSRRIARPAARPPPRRQAKLRKDDRGAARRAFRRRVERLLNEKLERMQWE